MSSLRYFAVILVAAILLVAGLSQAPRPAPHGFLGLEVAPLTRAAFARVPPLSPHGALIGWIYPLGPADIAGLKAGEVVTRIDGTAIESADQAAELIDRQEPGTRVELTVLDVASEDSKPKKIALVVLPGRPPSEKVYTVRPPRTLAREGDFGPTMAANASWSAKIARGPVKPFPLKLFRNKSCSALAPDGWAIVRAHSDGSEFGLASAGRHVKAIYLRVPAHANDPLTLVSTTLASIFDQRPQLGSPRALGQGFLIVQFGTLNNYAGFVLYRAEVAGAVALRIAGVPATEVEGLQPLAGTVLLSMRCDGVPDDVTLDDAVPPYAVSTRCLQGHCDEGDLAGAYNERLHTGYVHAEDGENFLIDPRKDIWAMGPSGSGTYRQIGGTVEKLAPGRTN